MNSIEWTKKATKQLLKIDKPAIHISGGSGVERLP